MGLWDGLCEVILRALVGVGSPANWETPFPVRDTGLHSRRRELRSSRHSSLCVCNNIFYISCFKLPPHHGWLHWMIIRCQKSFTRATVKVSKASILCLKATLIIILIYKFNASLLSGKYTYVFLEK